jgi:hypothetical protein
VRLADALQRVMAAGASEDESKTDLCRAMADRKIDVRVTIAASDNERQGQVFSGGNVGVPPHLGPGDLEWAQSRPLGQWLIGPRPGEHYTWIGGWKDRPLSLIEAFTADVVAVLCGGADVRNMSPATVGQEAAAIKALAAHLKSNPELKRVEAAAWCRDSGYSLGKRAFGRVWPEAREKAGLERIGAAGRKPKGPRKT